MPFTNENIGAFETALKQAAGVLLSPQQVDPYGGGDSQQVNLHVGTRRANEGDLTAGAVQDTNLIVTIDADDWDEKIGRPPQKGDVIWWLGNRHALDRSIVGAPGGNKVFYKARIQG